MAAMRLVCINGIYFKYPVDISLNDDDFLVALLDESRRAAPDMVHEVKKDETGFIF